MVESEPGTQRMSLPDSGNGTGKGCIDPNDEDERLCSITSILQFFK